MNSSELKSLIRSGGLDGKFASLYEVSENDERVPALRERWYNAVLSFEREFGEGRDVRLFSVPGRSEISGNHTDHQHGRVIAASITLDCIAVVSARDDSMVTVKSEGFAPDYVNIKKFTTPNPDRFFHSDALVAGVVDGFRANGYSVGGFDAYTTSNVLKGSGLSSSAAFEVMIGNILSHLYNGGEVSSEQLAIIARYAENVFFSKPCGLMDQMACAWGGLITIDFENPDAPVTEGLDFSLTKHGYSLCITDTGGNHTDLNDDYASVPAEMKSVANLLGHDVLRPVTYEELLSNAAEVREKCGDRALLRAIHFVAENERVPVIADALRRDDVDGFLAGIIASGDSSFKYLQNVYTTKDTSEQGLSVALAVTERFLSGKRAAWRVHGGGFAGTIQAFLPNEYAAEYKALMDGIFGAGKCMELRIRSVGATAVL
ncbi:MAG: galactokinase [Clostridia bacterium]|nr:galactokinase [Clostridia bacterium]